MNKLKELRNEFKYTVREVASITNIDRSTISNYENEDRKLIPEPLKILSDLYHVTIDYLLCHTDLGIYVYDNNNHRILLHESEFIAYKAKNQIEYKEGKRYLK